MKRDETPENKDQFPPDNWSSHVAELLCELAVDLGPPVDWDLTRDSKPRVLADLTRAGRWHDMRRLQGRVDGPLQLPTFEISPPHRGRTKPLARHDPVRGVEFENLAWLRDIGGSSGRAIARQQRESDEDRERIDTSRDIERGRARLREFGVLPWVAFEDGRPPDQWWTDRAFWDYFVLWWQQATSVARLVGSATEEMRAALMVIPLVTSLLKRALEAPAEEAPRGDTRSLVALALSNAQELEERLRQLARSRPEPDDGRGLEWRLRELQRSVDESGGPKAESS